MIPYEEAIQLIEQTVRPLEAETVSLNDATGRTLAADVTSDIDSPPYDKSMMDGFAVRSSDVEDGLRTFDVVATVAAGDVPEVEIQPGQCCRIMTGAPVPAGSDCVVVVEWTETSESDDGTTMSFQLPDGQSVASGRHIIRRAENIRSGSAVFQTGHVVRETETGLLAEIGASRLAVYRQPTVAVVPTGNELVDCGEMPGPGQIRNSNGPMLQSMLKATGCPDIRDAGIIGDNETQLRKAIEAGLEQDLLILTGGVSMGQFDLVPGILSDAGVEQVFHKVKMKPGKPVWFGFREKAGHRCYVFGLPGNPVSSLVGFQLLVRKAIGILSGKADSAGPKIAAHLAADHHARGDRPTFWPGRLVQDPTNPVRQIVPLAWKGSSDMSPLTETELLICFPSGTKLHQKGDQLEAVLI